MQSITILVSLLVLVEAVAVLYDHALYSQTKVCVDVLCYVTVGRVLLLWWFVQVATWIY